MQVSPEWIVAICAAVTLLITWTSSIAAGVMWIVRRLDSNKKEILADFQKKHDENSQKVEAMRVLVMRHDLILEPEFNGSGSHRAAKR